MTGVVYRRPYAHKLCLSGLDALHVGGGHIAVLQVAVIAIAPAAGRTRARGTESGSGPEGVARGIIVWECPRLRLDSVCIASEDQRVYVGDGGTYGPWGAVVGQLTLDANLLTSPLNTRTATGSRTR